MPISLCFVNYSTPISIQYPVQSPNTFTQHSQPWVQNCSKICIYLHPVNSMSYSKLYFGPFTTQLTPSHYTAQKKKNTHPVFESKLHAMFLFFLTWKTLFSKAKHLHYVIAKYILVTSTTSVNCLVSVKSAMHSCHTENTHIKKQFISHTQLKGNVTSTDFMTQKPFSSGVLFKSVKI